MAVQGDIIEFLREFAEAAAGEAVTIGPLPASGGIAMQVVTGFGEFTSLNRRNHRRMLTVSFLSKNENQSQAYSALCEIGNALQTTTRFTAANVLSADVKSDSALVGKDGDYWIYSMTAAVRIII